ncbi:MAG TPA: family 10 glycosylhydrolase, partial [Candidatus Caenarcaniphilales bacterium]
KPAQAQTACHLSSSAIAEQSALRRAMVAGDNTAQKRYRTLLANNAENLRRCREKTWPQVQAIWLRLYPCDLRPGALDELLDRIVARGYNRVYVEVFADGQVLLPAADNPTVWPSVVRTPTAAKSDLLADAIQKGHERGLKIYAWLFSMNFGYSYGQRAERQSVIARNGQGQTSLYVAGNGGPDIEASDQEVDKIFIDPYNPLAKQDYNRLLQEVLARKPDGVLFDYIRYPRQTGAASVAGKVQDLWIYGQAAQQALLQRATNQKGLNLIQRFLSRGYITAGDVTALDQLYPTEGEPLWQGRYVPTLVSNQPLLPAPIRQARLQQELWLLTAAHAFQGVLDFLTAAADPVRQQNRPAGVVFFSDGNRRIGQGFDSRMQPWDRFPRSLEWHPMAYGICGSPRCIVAQVQTILSKAPSGTQVSPVLAGVWGRAIGERPSLEDQMAALQRTAPQI